MFRYVVIIAALISASTIACSKKTSKPERTTVFIDEKPKGDPTAETPSGGATADTTTGGATSNTAGGGAPTNVPMPVSPVPPELELPQNPHLNPIISEIASQNMNPFKSTAEVLELANRITEVIFDNENSSFSIKTYSDETYNFKLEKSNNRTLYFNYYKDKTTNTIIYSCMVEDLSSADSNSIYLITLKDIKSKAQIKILNVKKTGAITIKMLQKFDYENVLIKDAKKLIERINETPVVDAEFYEILETSSTSQISRFNLVLSDFFKLNSKYSDTLVRKNKITRLPLLITGMGGFLSLFRSASYTSIKEGFYNIETEKLNPIYYNQLQLNFVLKQKPESKLEDPEIQLEIQFD